MLDFYIHKLAKNDLHDKVGDVCITSYGLTFDQRMKELVEANYKK